MKKRITAIVITVAMLVALVPSFVLAESMPKAEIEIKNNDVTYTTSGIFHLGGGFTGEQVDMTLQAIMEFTAINDKVDTYGEWITDFYITLDNLEKGSFIADEDCYIAGHYGDFGWIKIPLEGIELSEKTYPVMATAGLSLPYSEICDSVKVFTCGIHLSDAALKANPDIMVTLELGLSQDAVDIENPAYTTVLNTDGKNVSYKFDKACLEGNGLPIVEKVEADVEKLQAVDATKPVEEVVVGTNEEAAEVLKETTETIFNAIKEAVDSGDAETVKGFNKEFVDAIVANEVNTITTKVEIETKEEKDLPAADVSKVKVAADEKTIVQYLDLGVTMIAKDAAGNEVASTEITQLSDEITFTIAIPEELKTVKDGFVRKFYVIRVHEGKTDILPVTANDDGTLSFSTDKFSTYALAYADTPAKPDASPNTGDNNMAPLAVVGMALAAMAAVVATRRRTN